MARVGTVTSWEDIALRWCKETGEYWVEVGGVERENRRTNHPLAAVNTWSGAVNQAMWNRAADMLRREGKDLTTLEPIRKGE